MPHDAPEMPLLGHFSLVAPRPDNTFAQVLYLLHRDALLGPPIVVCILLITSFQLLSAASVSK